MLTEVVKNAMVEGMGERIRMVYRLFAPVLSAIIGLAGSIQ